MSILLEILGKGLQLDIQEVLAPVYFGDFAPDADEYDIASAKTRELLATGLNCWQCEDYQGAREAFKELCVNDPRCVQGKAAYASLLAELGNYTQALGVLRSLGRICPANALIEHATGLCYEKIHQPDSAAIHYRIASERDEYMTEPLYRLAAVNVALGQPEAAVEPYRALSKILPEHTWIRCALGNLLLLCDKPELAAQEFETYIAMEPENWSYSDPELNDLISAGEYREAIKVARAQLKQQGPFSDLLLQLANLYSMVGDDQPAVDYYTQALDQQPGYLEAAVKLATHHLLFGRIEEAAEWFGQAAIFSERLMVSYIGMGVAYSAAGDQTQASRSLQLANAVEPNSALLYSQMINLHWKIANMGEVNSMLAGDDQGHSRFRDQLHCHAMRVLSEPANSLARYQHGVLLRTAGDVQQATAEFLQVIRLNPCDMSALAKLGVMFTQQNQDMQAARMFHRMFYPGQDQLKFYYDLAIAYTMPGARDEIYHKAQDFFDIDEPADVKHVVTSALISAGLLDFSAISWRTLQATHKLNA